MLNLGCLERRKKKGAEGAKKAQRGYCPFWVCVVIELSGSMS